MNDFSIHTIDTDSGTRVHQVHTDHVNWIVLQDGRNVTLIDGGYPGHARTVLASLKNLGVEPKGIQAGLLTHAHIDHIGGMAALAAEYGFPVYTGGTEVPHARREYIEQAGTLDIARIALRPSTLAWLYHALPLGVLSRKGIGTTMACAEDAPMDIPGRPMPMPSPGHTSGHTAYIVADGRALVAGDALVTGHPLSKQTGPQRIPAFFDHDRDASAATLHTFLDLDCELLLPGHGPLHKGSVADAAQRALSNTGD